MLHLDIPIPDSVFIQNFSQYWFQFHEKLLTGVLSTRFADYYVPVASATTILNQSMETKAF